MLIKVSEDTYRRINRLSHTVILVLATLLVIYIAVETFRGVPFMSDSGYMAFQFWVCMAFMTVFFVEVAVAPSPWRYFIRNFLFLLISIPYLNIIKAMDMPVSGEALEYLRYIPLLRGVYAMVMVITAVSTSRIIGIFWSYLSIMVLVLFFGSMLFYVREAPVNPDVHTYWTSLWWCSLELTTIGAPINPVTPTGKVLAAVLASMGMIVFPLFTVYLSDVVRRYIMRADTLARKFTAKQ